MNEKNHYKINSLQERQDLVEETLSLIESCFSYKDPKYKFKNDFALLFNQKNYRNLFILTDNDKVIAHIGCLPRELIFKEKKYPILMWGGICVSPEYQGKGIFGFFFNDLQKIIDDHYALSLLWSGLDSTYEKFHFYECGMIQQINPHTQTKLTGLNNNQLSLEEKNSIIQSYQHYNQQVITIHRTEDDWTNIWNHPSVQTFKNKNSIAFGEKGMDLQNVLYEFHPPSSTESFKDFSKIIWNGFINESALSDEVLFAALVRIHPTDHFKKMIEEISSGKIKVLSIQNKTVEIAFDNQFFNINQNEFLKGIWGPGIITEFEGLVPPLYISGIDSI